MSRPRLYDWTDAQDTEIIRRFGDPERQRVKEIARALGVPTHAVASRIEHLRSLGRIGFRYRKWSAPVRASLLAARAAGARYREIAPLLGCTAGAARQQASLARKAAATEQDDQLELRLEAA